MNGLDRIEDNCIR